MQTNLVRSTAEDEQVVRGFEGTFNASTFTKGTAAVTSTLFLEVTIQGLQMVTGNFAGSFPAEGARAVLDCAKGPQIVSDAVPVNTVGATTFLVDLSAELGGVRTAAHRSSLLSGYKSSNVSWLERWGVSALEAAR